MVGSVHYNAPEMLRYELYDCKSDIWSMGVILYELLCCDQPFRGKGKNDKDKERATEKAIKSGKYKISKYFKGLSRSAQDLIDRLLDLDVDRRLSYEEILEHPWMKKNAPQLNGKRSVSESKKSRTRTRSRTRSVERAFELAETDMEDESEEDNTEMSEDLSDF